MKKITMLLAILLLPITVLAVTPNSTYWSYYGALDNVEIYVSKTAIYESDKAWNGKILYSLNNGTYQIDDMYYAQNTKKSYLYGKVLKREYYNSNSQLVKTTIPNTVHQYSDGTLGYQLAMKEKEYANINIDSSVPAQIMDEMAKLREKDGINKIERPEIKIVVK